MRERWSPREERAWARPAPGQPLSPTKAVLDREGQRWDDDPRMWRWGRRGGCPRPSVPTVCCTQSNKQAPLPAPSRCLRVCAPWLGIGVWERELERAVSSLRPPPVLSSSFSELTIQYGAQSPAGMMTGFLGDEFHPWPQAAQPQMWGTLKPPPWWLVPTGLSCPERHPVGLPKARAGG